MDRINSMVMVEKLKSTLAEELKRTLTQQQIKSKKKSTSVGTKNQVESFLVILNSGYNANLCHNIIYVIVQKREVELYQTKARTAYSQNICNFVLSVYRCLARIQ
jgi:hypothetical protein